MSRLSFGGKVPFVLGSRSGRRGMASFPHWTLPRVLRDLLSATVPLDSRVIANMASHVRYCRASGAIAELL